MARPYIDLAVARLLLGAARRDRGVVRARDPASGQRTSPHPEYPLHHVDAAPAGEQRVGAGGDVLRRPVRHQRARRKVSPG